MIEPARILKKFEFCSNIFPSTDAAAPNNINTKENPSENNNSGNILTFLLSINSFNDCPDTKEMYPGISGNTHGDKKLINPAPNAINNSIIIYLFCYNF